MGVEFGILLNRPSFFSIDSLINILVVAEGAGIDVNGGEFMTELDTLVTGIWIIISFSSVQGQVSLLFEYILIRLKPTSGVSLLKLSN